MAAGFPWPKDRSHTEEFRPMSRLLVLKTLVLALSIPIATLAAPAPSAEVSESGRLRSGDLYKLRSAGTVALSPDEARVAYTVVNRDRPGRPYSQVWVLELATRPSKAGRHFKNVQMDPFGLAGDDGSLLQHASNHCQVGRSILSPVLPPIRGGRPERLSASLPLGARGQDIAQARADQSGLALR